MESYFVIGVLLFAAFVFAAIIYIVGSRLKSNPIKLLGIFFGAFMVIATLYAPLIQVPQVKKSFENGESIYCGSQTAGVKRVINKRDGRWVIVGERLDNEIEGVSISLYACERVVK